MTNEQGQMWFRDHRHKYWDLIERSDFKKYRYGYRRKKGEGGFEGQTIWCISDAIFIELIDAGNAQDHWGEYVSLSDIPRRESSGQLLMF